MNIEDFMRQGAIRMKMRDYAQKRDYAINVAEDALRESERAYVSVSGGKDSVVCACIVDAAARRLDVDFVLWAHISDASFPGTLGTCELLAKRLNRKLVIDRSPISAYDALKNPQKRAFGKSGYFFSAIQHWVETSKCDLCFTGVRAYESQRRMTAAKMHGTTFHSDVAGDITVCNPITWFRLEDVAAAIVEYGAPLHPIYSKWSNKTERNKFGEDGFIRLGYITSRDLLNIGTAQFIRINYPEQWQKLCEAYPEIRSYI